MRFAQVAAGDSCSFALTDTGLVFGWGTFKVWHSFLIPFFLTPSLSYVLG
jgi:alpha-tubulin suppressor-like RCC1 family protein